MKSIVFQQLRAVAPLFAAVMAAVSCGSGSTDGTAGTDVAEEIPAVTVQQVEKDGWVTLSVTDHGPGIAKEDPA